MNEKKSSDCVLGATNEQRIKGLEARMKTIEQAVIDIRDRLLGRPSWAVMVIITSLSSICAGLLMTILR